MTTSWHGTQRNMEVFQHTVYHPRQHCHRHLWFIIFIFLLNHPLQVLTYCTCLQHTYGFRTSCSITSNCNMLVMMMMMTIIIISVHILLLIIILIISKNGIKYRQVVFTVHHKSGKEQTRILAAYHPLTILFDGFFLGNFLWWENF